MVAHFTHGGQLRFPDDPTAVKFAILCNMRADRVEVSWDNDKHKWLVRISAGSEVIRRHCDHSRDAADSTLRAAAGKTVSDEGYEIDDARISISR